MVPPLFRLLLLFGFWVENLASAIGAAVRASMVSQARFAALRASHQLGQGQMQM
jgi:hypothetical protein